MSKTPKDGEEVSRREFLKHGAAGAVALPFALAIPSNAKNVVTRAERLGPFKEREAAWHEKLVNRLNQGTRPLPPGTKQPPPPTRREPVPYNTTYDTSKSTTKETSTNSQDPPRADDSDSDTHHDGTKEDWKTDYH